MDTEDEAIDAAIHNLIEGEYLPFSGQNCDDPCSGWDGVSRRCECGNRRVDWVADEMPDGRFVAYGEAY